MVTTRSGAQFYGVGESWVESTPVLTQDTAVLRILGGDADVDNFILSTRSNILDVKGEVLADKVRAVRETFLDNFYYGSGTAPFFKGMHAHINDRTYNSVTQAASSTAVLLSIVKLQETIDLINGWEPNQMVMTKMMRRYINVYLDSVGDKFTAMRDQYGKMIEYFRGIQVVTDDILLNTELPDGSGYYTAKTGGDSTTIFIFTYAPKACCGIQGPKGIETVPLGDLETKDAQRWRIKWYCGAKFEDLRSCAKLDGIDPNGTVAA